MKANELMIGDWVYNPFTRKTLRLTFGRDLDLAEELCLEPIPLNAEILEKNGFEQDDYYLQFTLYLDNKRAKSRSIVMLPQDEEWSEIDMTLRCNKADVTMELCYVHELQHALRLCGIEKEIEL